MRTEELRLEALKLAVGIETARALQAGTAPSEKMAIAGAGEFFRWITMADVAGGCAAGARFTAATGPLTLVAGRDDDPGAGA